MSNLTLWEIEKGIVELFDARDEADTPEAQRACEQAIAEYFAREVSKVDAIRGLYKHFDALAVAARQEARDIATRAQIFERRCDSIKEMAKVVMEANGLTRLEGRSGRLLLKGNGGLQPLEVTDPAQVPDECCKMVGWLGADMWAELIRFYEMTENGQQPVFFEAGVDYKLERVVDNDRTRTVIEQEGGVPGARLGERGKHVEVK